MTPLIWTLIGVTTVIVLFAWYADTHRASDDEAASKPRSQAN